MGGGGRGGAARGRRRSYTSTGQRRRGRGSWARSSRGPASTGGRCARGRTGARTPATTGPRRRGQRRCGRTTTTPAWGAVAGQGVDPQADQGAFDDGQLAVAGVFPGRAVGEPGGHPVPGPGP